MPNRKVTAGALAGAVTTIIIGVLQMVNPDASLPPGIEGSTVLVLSFLFSYFVRENETPKQDS